MALDDATRADSVAAARRLLPGRAGFCAQVRSLPDRVEAERVAATIRAATALPVSLQDKDLGARGTWTRLCVGDEDSEASITARATGWTAPGGILEPHLVLGSPDEPRFLILPLPEGAARRPTELQARAALERGVLAPAHLVGDEGGWLVARAPRAPAREGHMVIAIGPAGEVVPLAGDEMPGCAACAVAFAAEPIASQDLVAAGAFVASSPAPAGAPPVLVDIAITESTAAGARALVVVSLQGGAAPTFVRHAALLLDKGAGAADAAADFVGEALVVEADGDAAREIAVARTELRFLGDDLCAVRSRAELWEPTPGGFLPLAAAGLVDGGASDEVLTAAITALDAAGDAEAASRACAQVLGRRPLRLVAQLCLQRIRTLVGDGRHVDAVNAAGLLAEGAPDLRAAVAGPFFRATAALEKDARLVASPVDCEQAPLLPGARSRPRDEQLRQARARLRERVTLADLVDAVFVTGSRDFGPETPVGQATARWQERLRVAQPARHAAIEALLLPPSEPAPEPAAPRGGGGDGGGGGTAGDDAGDDQRRGPAGTGAGLVPVVPVVPVVPESPRDGAAPGAPAGAAAVRRPRDGADEGISDGAGFGGGR